MSTKNVTNLLRGNDVYSSGFKDGSLALPPANKLAVVTCMDARIDPAAAFGIPLGGAHVIRNAGGSAQDALRSLIISQQLLATDEIQVIKHTGCGMLTFQNADARGVVAKNLGAQAGSAVEQLDFLPFPELDRAVKDDVAFLKGSPLITKNIAVTGWVYEVETGKVRQVV